MRRLDFVGALEVGGGAGDFEDATVGAGGERRFVDRELAQSFRVWLGAQ